jgi:2-methylisocitrate lyase-like PEP mutase family enzyme
MNHSPAELFRQLHRQDGIFVLPNPWDTGSAKIMEAMGFQALATTSAGYAFTQGRLDRIGGTSRQEALAHAAQIIAATTLPVSADLEDGFGRDPEAVAETIRQAAAVGLSGCTIEDATGDPAEPILDRTLAIERIEAAAEVVKSLAEPFMLTARSENFLHGRPDLDDTLARLSGYESVGADVLYAPGLPDLAAVRQICAAVVKPVNVVAGLGLRGVSLAELKEAGVKRVSVGSSLARTALGAWTQAALAIQNEGSFEAFDSAPGFKEISRWLS